MSSNRLIYDEETYKTNLSQSVGPYAYTLDPVRYESIALALNTIDKQKLDGAIAEVGVYRGETSKVINKFVSNKKIYLFDTFAGFPENHLEVDQDDRFRDTNIELVKKNIGDCSNIEFKPGYFPESAIGIEDSSFCFVLLDPFLIDHLTINIQ